MIYIHIPALTCSLSSIDEAVMQYLPQLETLDTTQALLKPQ